VTTRSPPQRKTKLEEQVVALDHSQKGVVNISDFSLY